MNQKTKILIYSLAVLVVLTGTIVVYRNSISDFFLARALNSIYANNLNAAKIFLGMAGFLKNSAQYNYLSGNISLLKKNYESAASYYTRALELGFEPKEWALLKRASIYQFYIVNYEKALNDYLKIEKGVIDSLSTSHEGAMMMLYQPLASLYIELGKPNEAIASIGKIMKLELSDVVKAQNYAILGRAYYTSGQYQNAADAFKKSLELDVTTFVRVYLARSLKHLGDTKGAIAEINKVLKQEPDYEPAICALAGVYNQTKEYDKSIEVSQKIIAGAVNDNNVLCFYYAAAAYYSKKDFASAKANFEKIINADKLTQNNDYQDLKASAEELLSKIK